MKQRPCLIQTGEKGFIEECHDMLHQRTVIMITHRPASLALADRVLKLEKRKIEVVDGNA